MRRINPWPLVGVGLSLVMLVVVGCGRGTPSPPVAIAGAKPATTTGDVAANTQLFRNWPKPLGAIVISGEQVGYLAPCGCTEGQRGGLIRRMIFIEKLRAQGWPLSLIDLGSLINDPNTRGGPEEAKARYDTALKALAMLRYDAVAFSAVDLKLQVQEVLTQIMNLGDRPTFVAANVRTTLGLEDKLAPAIRSHAGPVPIGITAVTDPAAVRAVNDPDAGTLLELKAPEEVLPKVLADLERDTRVQVLMVQGPPETARRLAKSYPGFDVVVATSPNADTPPSTPEWLNGHKTLLVQVGRKGQYVGVVGLFDDAKAPYRYQRVELWDRYDKDPEMVKLGEPMRRLLDEQFPELLKVANVLETYTRRRYAFSDLDVPADATFVGAEACKDCHPRSYQRWARSRHAHAYDGLTQPGRNREWDAECVSCHTTGFEYLTGYRTPTTTPHLKGNQCENCHGPSSKHAADPDNLAYRQAVARDAVDWEENHRCLQCHDEDNDTDFKFGRDWTLIDHTGLDDYADPKTHRKTEPKKVARSGE